MPIDRSTVVGYHDHSGAKIRKLGRVTGPASYPTGGETGILAALGMSRVDVFLVECATNGTDLRLVLYNYANNQIKWFDLAGAEIANTTNLSTYSARFEAIGV